MPQGTQEQSTSLREWIHFIFFYIKHRARDICVLLFGDAIGSSLVNFHVGKSPGWQGEDFSRLTIEVVAFLSTREREFVRGGCVCFCCFFF